MEFQENLNNKWRWNLFSICVVLAAIGSVTEIVIYLYDSAHKTLFLPLPLYRARFIYIPSTLNIIVIILTAFILRWKRLSNRTKNAAACFLIYFLCANTQCIHYVYGPLLMLPSIAIFVSILFADKILTILITIASFISLAIASYQASIELRQGDPQLLSDTGLAALVFLVSYFGASLLTNYVSQQMNYILNSNARQKKLIEECNVDPLLGINNRRALENELADICNTQSEESILVMIDIDDFKRVNDTYGHLYGDEVLIHLADLLKENKQYFSPYRYGGEEIILIMSSITLSEAYSICDQIRQNFENSKYSFSPKEKITFSAGMHHYVKGMSGTAWINSADQLMYVAKSNGKNCIMTDKI